LIAKHWQQIDEETIKCQICPRNCLIKLNKHGYCFVRKNENHQSVLSVYGLSSGFSIDPIEKKPLYHFYPNSNIFSFGTIGCNLNCNFCQNWHISRAQNLQICHIKATPQNIVQAALNKNCHSVAFTYNEPIIFYEYVMDTARECQKNGLKTVTVTNGYINKKMRPKFFKHIDAANIDLKSISEDFYQHYCQAQLAPVLDTIKYLANETKTWVELTNLIIPQANDSTAELHRLTEWIAHNVGPDVPLHFSRFHPSYKLQNKPSTPLETLLKAKNIAKSKGLKYIYLGNIQDENSAHTYCYNCQTVLIERYGYHTIVKNLNKNHCLVCNTKISGMFSK
jgi:pyruvate formate lyase activating enzyme